MKNVRQNNFDFLRLFFSTLVIFSHSFPLTNTPEPFEYFFPNTTSLGGLSVDAFFAMSGFLIFNSIQNSKTLLNYVWKRCLRILPGLFIMLVLTLIVLLLIYPNIFHLAEFKSYLPNNLSLYNVQYFIGDVFASNPYPKAINGSLWSLSYEFSMYIFMMIFFFFRSSKYLKHLIFLSFIGFYFLNIFKPYFLHNYFSIVKLDSTLFFRLAPFFLAGAAFSFIKTQFFNKKIIQVLLIILLLSALMFNLYKEIFPLALTLLILPFATYFNKYLEIPKAIGDISYGVYIYGFIIQQLLMKFFNFNAISLFIVTIPITYLLSYFSWKLIEKPALKHKNIL